MNHIRSECKKSSKVTQKQYKTRLGWVGKVIHREIYKKSKFDHTNKLYNNQAKKRSSKIVDLAVTADHGVKLKENEKKDEYLYIAKELKKKLCKVTFMLILIIKGTEGLGRDETFQPTTLLRVVRILRRDLETWADLLSVRDDPIYFIISESSKLAQKEYKSSLDFMGKAIPWDLGNTFSIRANVIYTTQHLS